MIRKATFADIDGVERVYDHIHSAIERGDAVVGWKRGIYPTRETASAALCRNDLFVQTEDGVENARIVGAAVFNRIQVDVYAGAPWAYEAPDDQVMVMHTLVVDPQEKGKGFGRAFAAFYERYARENGCSVLRIDTNALNLHARAFYAKLGYREVAIRPCVFNDLPDVNLVLLEKRL